MTSAALSGLTQYGEQITRAPQMKCFSHGCSNYGSNTVTLLFYLRPNTKPATLTPLGVILCGTCGSKANVSDFLGDEGWDQIMEVFDQFEKQHPRRELTALRVNALE